MAASDNDVRREIDEETARYHREVYDWDDPAAADGYEIHSRGLDFGLLLFRVGLLMLVLHGLHKAGDMSAFTAQVDSNFVGAQAPEFLAWMVMLGQVVLPVLIALGLFTRPAAFLCAAMMVSIWALVIASRLDYRVLDEHGALTGETALLYTVLALPLAFTGAGRWSLDTMRTAGRP